MNNFFKDLDEKTKKELILYTIIVVGGIIFLLFARGAFANQFDSLFTTHQEQGLIKDDGIYVPPLKTKVESGEYKENVDKVDMDYKSPSSPMRIIKGKCNVFTLPNESSEVLAALDARTVVDVIGDIVTTTKTEEWVHITVMVDEKSITGFVKTENTLEVKN